MYPFPTASQRGLRASVVAIAAVMAFVSIPLIAPVTASATSLQQLQTLAQTFGSKGLLNHTIRFPSGGWQPFGDVEGQTGALRSISGVAAAGSAAQLHVLAISPDFSNNDGRLYHAIRGSSGQWTAFGDVATQTGSPGPVGDVAAAAIAGDLHVVVVSSNTGRLYHTIRRADGTWLRFGDVNSQTGTPGYFSSVATAAVGGDLHVLARTIDGNLYHAVRRADGSWTRFGDVKAQAGNKGQVTSVDAATVAGELHVVISADVSTGAVYHTIRHADGTWTPFGDVKTQSGNPGGIRDVAAASVNNELHVLAATGALAPQGQVFHTVRHADGSWSPFGNVEEQAGDIGQAYTVAAAGVQFVF